MLHHLRRRLMLGITAGMVVVLIVIFLSDASKLADAVRAFDWRLLPLILGLTVGNYILRFIKWQYYLRLLEVTTVSLRDSALIFVAGFAMVMTPGKIGEVLKSYLLRVRSGVPMSRTAPVIFAERFSDGVAMLVLASVGLLVFRHGWQVFVLGAVLSVVGLIMLQQERFIHRILRWAGGTRFGHGRIDALVQLYDSTRTLLRIRPLIIAVSIGVLSWFGECVAFYLVLTGLGVSGSWDLLFAATFVFAASTWIGGASMLPGGLGAAELSVAGLLLLTVNDPVMTSSLAGTATLLIRFATLWFGVIIGIVGLSRVSSWQENVGDGPVDSVDGADRHVVA